MAQQQGPTEHLVNNTVNTVQTVGEAAIDVLQVTKDTATHTVSDVADDLIQNARSALAAYLEALRKAANAVLPG